MVLHVQQEPRAHQADYAQYLYLSTLYGPLDALLYCCCRPGSHGRCTSNTVLGIKEDCYVTAILGWPREYDFSGGRSRICCLQFSTPTSSYSIISSLTITSINKRFSSLA
ncbi:hypothetical protein PHMEG_00015233 [Phytophthora megakarya]|uniref:Uncharacterized protein n=1 Tax=Phytophthora megakarya TaxID=4795 RepID=A0A225W1Z6_9STRA|nr:hypothetical protein PHMEG_00015233 [Phytophthora megakarya]